MSSLRMVAPERVRRCTASTSGIPPLVTATRTQSRRCAGTAGDGVSRARRATPSLTMTSWGPSVYLSVMPAGRHRVGNEDDMLAADQLVHVAHERGIHVDRVADQLGDGTAARGIRQKP